MGPVLDGLTQLQSVENRLRASKTKLSRCRRNVILQENRVRNLQNDLQAKHDEIMLMKVQSDRLQLELNSRDESIAKVRGALNTAKTNKEYAALLTQLNTSKADNSKLESQILELMKNIEADDAHCAEIKAQIDGEKNKLDDVRKETEVAAAKHEAEILEIQAEWDQAAKNIPAEALEVFDRVAETYDGQALANVEMHDSRTQGYSCSGCFMGLTTETANVLMTKDEIIRCPNCTRILVFGDSET